MNMFTKMNQAAVRTCSEATERGVYAASTSIIEGGPELQSRLQDFRAVKRPKRRALSLCQSGFRWTLHALALATVLALMIPSTARPQGEPIFPFKIESPEWYIQVGIMVNPTYGAHVFANPPAGPGLWCTPAQIFVDGASSVAAWDYPLCPGGDGTLQRTRHDSAPHAGDDVPSYPWSFSIACAIPSSPFGAREGRVAGVVSHPGLTHVDQYGAVVGALLGTVAGPGLEPMLVAIHGSIGRHTTSPPPPAPSPMIGGCNLQPPSGHPSPGNQDYPAGELLTIVDPASGKLVLLAVVANVTPSSVTSVYVRNGVGGPILANLRPLMQARVLVSNTLTLTITNSAVSTNVAQVMASGAACIEVMTSSHPDGKISGTLAAISTQSSYQVLLQPGWNVVANQLSRGSNTLAEVIPDVPTGSLFYRWDANIQGYSSSVFSPAWGGWDSPTLSLSPGEGGFIRNPSSSNFTVTFVGETVQPHLPLSLPPSQLALVARQIPAPATYEEITGMPPAEGVKLYRYDSVLQGDPTTISNWQAYSFSQGVWIPGTPSVGVGEPVFIQVPTNANQAPVMAEIPDQTMHAGATLRLTIPGYDPDGPPNQMSYQLDVGPAGATIDAVTGEFTWHSQSGDIGTTNPVLVSLRDTGTPVLSAAKAFNIVVVAPPRIESVTLTENGLELGWHAIPGNLYRVETAPRLGSTSWTTAATDLMAAEADTYWTVSDIRSTDIGFYRLVDLCLPTPAYFPVPTTTTNNPGWTCCERNIRFPKEAFAAPTTGTTFADDNNTRRYLQLNISLPILFECNSVQTQKCIADVSVVVESTPRQSNGEKYVLEADEQTLSTSVNPAPPNCDGAKHTTTLTIKWAAWYPQNGDIKGNLKLKLSVIAAKGTIDHTLFIEVQSAGGNKVTLGKPKLVPAK
jgi:hypothetical protein